MKKKGLQPIKLQFTKLSYDGQYPNLCSGTLIVTIGSTEWVFPSHCLSSGGRVTFDENWSENVEQGEWTINQWPEGFPENLKYIVEQKVNEEIPWGCCGGCV